MPQDVVCTQTIHQSRHETIKDLLPHVSKLVKLLMYSTWLLIQLNCVMDIEWSRLSWCLQIQTHKTTHNDTTLALILL